MSKNLKMPWSMEDTTENMKHIRNIMIKKVRQVNYEGKAEEDVREINFDFNRVITALEEIKQYRALGTVEECREAVEKQRVEKADREGNGCADEKLLTGWIPIEERRPKTDTTVLVTTSEGNVDTDFLRTSTRWYFSDDCVTAWMPLPEPYKPVEMEDSHE